MRLGLIHSGVWRQDTRADRTKLSMYQYFRCVLGMVCVRWNLQFLAGCVWVNQFGFAMPVHS